MGLKVYYKTSNMSEFKFSKKPNRSTSNVDGFLSDAAKKTARDDVRVRFRQNYRPVQKSFDSDFPRPENVVDSEARRHVESQLKTSSRASNTATNNLFDFSLDDEPKDQKKRFRLLSIFSRRKHERTKRSFGKRVLRTAGIFMVVLMLGAGSIVGYAFIKQRQIFKGNGEGAAALEKNVDPARLNGEGDGRVNILLLGKGGPGHEAPDLTDTILLASIDPVQNEAALVSVPRDFYVEDVAGNQSKINAVYSNAKQAKLLAAKSDSDADKQLAEDAGLKAVKQVVSEVLGVPVHYYMMIDFTAFKESIDTVGGITIDVKEPLYDSTMAWLNNWNPLIADEGLQTFNGTRALMYARSRYGSARGDFDRSERQKEVIFALQQKVLTLGTFSNPFKVIELLNTLGDNVRTDLNGTGEVKRLYEIGQQISGDKFISVSLVDPSNQLVSTDQIAGQSVVVPLEGMFQYEEIHSYIRNTLRDAFLKSENARIAILNGTTTAGLASFREKELKSYGYNIVMIDNAPTSDYETSRFIDVSNGAKPYTASYLERRLSLTKESASIDGLPTSETVDFVIILGNDEAAKTTSR
jgi:LCP family protein required for cell wall assembly